MASSSSSRNVTPMASIQPPGPLLQKLNALLHQEPIASVAHALYWIFALTVMTPMATIFLCAQAVYAVLVWTLGLTGEDKYHPRALSSEKELAVVITGCDTGFGKELALIAANAGFVVFAGCLSKDSFAQFKDTTIIPIVMDVTKDADVQATVEAVEKWIAAKKDKSRVLHALCNNAGILISGFVDWHDLSAVQKTMDGKLNAAVGDIIVVHCLSIRRFVSRILDNFSSETEVGFAVNFMGVVRCCKAFLPLLKQQVQNGTHTGAARILNMSSMAGKLVVCGNLTTYSASKHAVVAFSHGLRVDLAPFGIQVGTFCPTFHGTPMVQDAKENFDAQWKKLPKEVVEEYGEGAYLPIVT